MEMWSRNILMTWLKALSKSGTEIKHSPSSQMLGLLLILSGQKLKAVMA